WLVRWVYVKLGGTIVLGMALGTAVRLILAALVLGVPTMLMGGTLPAVGRAVETDDDARRRHVALLYGVNTLGSVCGCLLATFFMLEIFGDRSSLWIAALINLAVAVVARRLSRLPEMTDRHPASSSWSEPSAAESLGSPSRTAPGWMVLIAATVVGFAFFLMEIVWYRMLGPLLGGTVFTFGLILAVALFGIGLGGAFYSLNRSSRPVTLRGFAYTCLLEAACIAIPFALGDRIAVLAALLWPLGSIGFVGHIAAWSAITGIVVLPAAFVAGAQFPLLIALIGQARQKVGSQIGLIYASNTAGAICGSLAGGFGLIPALTAPGCWRLVIVLLSFLGICAAVIAAAPERRWARLLPDGALASGALLLAFALGPTAAWRHSPIGAGRVESPKLSDPNTIRDWINTQRLFIRWEAEGLESSVALGANDAWSFILNGKADGNARADAPTVVMAGLVGAMIHPRPSTALVIGLGTGSTAGWLAAVPGIERVDVIELEPAILEVAKACAAVNANALANPKIHIAIGDAREVLLTSRRNYDLIFSEPSNPYRAGIASLFTRNFYEGAATRLSEAGIFMQWVQGYEVDAHTLRSVYATIGSVFPEVETWQLGSKDLLLLASRKPLIHDATKLRSMIAGEPFRTALAATWRVNDLEGFLAHYVAGADLVRAIYREDSDYVSTDDQNYVESGFARDVGKRDNATVAELQRTAGELKVDRPVLINGDADWDRFEERRLTAYATSSSELNAPSTLTADQRHRIRAQTELLALNRKAGLSEWRAQGQEPQTLNELSLMAEALADVGDGRAELYVERLRPYQSTEAEALLSRLRFRQGRISEAADLLIASFEHFEQDPWPFARIMNEALNLALFVASKDKDAGQRIFQVLLKPFAVEALNTRRMITLLNLSRRLDFKATCAQAFKEFEPYVSWDRRFLTWRQNCYELNQSPLLVTASAELQEFLDHDAFAFGAGLSKPSGETASAAQPS
ncbi:MAG TPA: fused MFS/spermidine synthase, partial [Myxococcaceae bacterium]|nr:fused MFS/spermidine synthase [Myxococcaceae bacterium]